MPEKKEWVWGFLGPFPFVQQRFVPDTVVIQQGRRGQQVVVPHAGGNGGNQQPAAPAAAHLGRRPLLRRREPALLRFAGKSRGNVRQTEPCARRFRPFGGAPFHQMGRFAGGLDGRAFDQNRKRRQAGAGAIFLSIV